MITIFLVVLEEGCFYSRGLYEILRVPKMKLTQNPQRSHQKFYAWWVNWLIYQMYRCNFTQNSPVESLEMLARYNSSRLVRLKLQGEHLNHFGILVSSPP